MNNLAPIKIVQGVQGNLNWMPGYNPLYLRNSETSTFAKREDPDDNAAFHQDLHCL